jgi:hypothetical protein
MGIVLSFSPFIVYALLSGRTEPGMALFAGAAVAVALLLRDHFIRHRRPKILEIGTALLFGGLGAYLLWTRGAWRVPEVRLAVDAGLLAIVLLSMASRQPFTLQYAREQVPAEVQGSPHFLAANMVITAVWALAFALMAGADLIMARAPQVPLPVGIAITVAALAGAAAFTGWYPGYLQRKAQEAG